MPAQVVDTKKDIELQVRLLKAVGLLVGTWAKHKNEPVTLKRRLAKLYRDLEKMEGKDGQVMDRTSELHPVYLDALMNKAGIKQGQSPKRQKTQ